MRVARQVLFATAALLAFAGTATAAAAASLKSQSMPLAGTRFQTAWGEVEVTSGGLSISWEPAPTDYETRWRGYNILLVAEARGVARGERYLLQACCSGNAEVGEDPLPPGLTIEVDGPSAARHSGQFSEALFPFSLVQMETLRSVRDVLRMRILLAPGMPAPAVITVALGHS